MQKRRLLSLLTALVLCLTLLPVTAFADDTPVLATEHYDFIKDDIAYKKVSDTEVEVAIYKWVTPPSSPNAGAWVRSGYDDVEVNIPATVSHENVEYTVVGLAVNAFTWSTPKFIKLPESENFTYIKESALMNVTLQDDKTLTIPASVTDIGPSAFANSNLTSITFEEGSKLKNIGRQAFDKCDEITSLTLPDTVESIGYAAFAGTGLTEITIPANAVIDAEVFNGFYGEGKTITFATGSQYQIKDGVLYSSDTLLNVLELEESVEIPEGIKYIGDNAFGFHMTGTESYRDVLKSVTFPSTLVSIGKNAFCSNKALTSITIPASVTYIGDSAFKSCSNLKSVTFEGTGLTEISDGMFAGCTSLVSIDIPEGVTKIGNEAFGTSAPGDSTPCTSLTTVNLPETVTSIGNNAFGWCNRLSNIELPSSLTEIGPFAFVSTAITSAVVPEGVTEIPQGTFANCTNLKTLVLPSTLTSVGSQALQGALQAEGSVLVMQGETPPSFDNGAFNYDGTKPTAGAFTVIVPSGSEENYKENDMIGTVVSGTDDKPTLTYSLDLSKYSINVIEGKTDSLSFTFNAPEGYKVIIENSNISVAEVTPNENTITVKALKDGTATIRVSIVSNDDSITLVTKTCEVTVASAVVPVESISLDQTQLELYVGDTETLTATVLPTDATNKAVTWESNNAAVATVDNGTVTAVGEGEATIKVTTNNKKTASCTVTVTRRAYGISATPYALDFGNAYPGYWQPDARIVTVTNTGNQTVTIDQPVAGDWLVVGNLSVAELAPDGTATFTVQPKADLPVGTYSETIRVTGSNDVGADITVSFAVVERPVSSGGVTPPSHDISVDSGSHGDVEIWPEEAKQGTTVTITATPDKGYEVAEVVVTAENGKEITVTDKGNNKYTFMMPGSDVTIEVTFQPVSDSSTSGDLTITAPAGWVNPYTDVAANAWYYNAVGYATANGLMGGVGNNAFDPSGSMNRAMVWTVIARLAGQTISGESWAEDARAWAMAQGVSDGTNPDGAVSREELVTMLYRYVGSPAMNVPELALIGNYPDSADVSGWAESAFAWAISKGIIEGRDGKLAAGDSITRAEAATILARFHLLTK